MKLRWFILVLAVSLMLCTTAFASQDAQTEAGGFSVIEVIVCVAIGAGLSFLIPMAYMKGQLKSVRSRPAAESYVRDHSMVVTQSREIFLYRNVTRTPRPKQNNKR